MNSYPKIQAALMSLPVLLVSSCQAWSPVPEPDMQKYELRGDVASMKNIVYKLDSTADGYVASGIEASMSNVYLEFDTAGRMTLMQRINIKNQPGLREEYTYGRDGRMLSKSVILSDGTLKEKSDYRYRRGRLHTLTVKDGVDSLVRHEKYKYFGRDSVIAEFTFNGDTLNGYRVSRYDRLGRSTGMSSYTAGGRRLLSGISIEYDSLGRRSLIKTDDIFFKKIENRLSYDADGFCSRQELTGRGGVTELSFSFKTDSAGNWTERVTSRDGIPIRIEIRDIQYR